MSNAPVGPGAAMLDTAIHRRLATAACAPVPSARAVFRAKHTERSRYKSARQQPHCRRPNFPISFALNNRQAIDMASNGTLTVASWACLLATVFPLGASATPICVKCDRPTATFRCQISKSEMIETLSFGHRVLERTCLKALKVSLGLHECRIEDDSACIHAPLKEFTLKAARRILLGEPEHPIANSDGSPIAAVSPATISEPPGNPVWRAWQRFTALFILR
jgi:hypothetical protein